MKSASINVNLNQLETVTTTEGAGKTFTEKAAKEIITRISNRLNELELEVDVNINEMYIGTLHPIYLKVLKDNLEYTRIRIPIQV